MSDELEELRELDPQDSMEKTMEVMGKVLKKIRSSKNDEMVKEGLDLIYKKELESSGFYMRPVDDDGFYNQLVEFHFDRNEEKRADHYRRMLDQRQARKWTIRGDCSAVFGNHKRAVVLLKRALFFGPHKDVVHEVKAALERSQKRVDKATSNLEKALHKVEIDPKNMKALAQSTVHLLDLDRVEEAWDLNKKCLRLEPDDFDAQYRKGCILFTKGELKKAKKMFTDLIKVNPKSMNARRAYNWIVEMMGGDP